MGNLNNADTTDIGLNQIYNNGNSGKIFDLFNNTIDSIKAENNYWGSALQTLSKHIFFINRTVLYSDMLIIFL